MRVLFIGDIVGSPGRKAVKKYIGELRSKYRFDYCVANGENAAGGSGITYIIAQELYGYGIHCINMGNHTWSRKEISTFIEGDTRMVRPANYSPELPGNGSVIIDGRLGVINLLGGSIWNGRLPFRSWKGNWNDKKKGMISRFHAEPFGEMCVAWYATAGSAQ